MAQYQKNKNPQPKDQQTNIVLLRLCSSQKVFIEQREIDVRSVRANVEGKLAEDSRAAVIIKVEAEVSTGLLVMAMDQVRAAEAAVSVSPMTNSCADNHIASTH